MNCCGILFAVTVYSDSPSVLNGLLLLPAIAIYLNQSAPPPRRMPKPAQTESEAQGQQEPLEDVEPDRFPVKPFVTHYRGAMMVVTCVCILAVDFPVFPRRFAKTESLGTSLMDLGVGSFVFSAGVVAARQHLKIEDDSTPRTPFVRQLSDAIRNSLPLMALGFIRLYSVKGLDYAEHVSEYGVHWNFFFTLAAIPPLVALLRPLIKLTRSFAIIGYGVSIVQQTFYTYSGVVLWAVTAPRVDWLSMNREGLVSLPGYLAIFLSGYGIGTDILQRDQSSLEPQTEQDQWIAATLGGEEKLEEMRSQQRRIAIIALAKWSLIWCVIYYFTTGFYGPRLVVSRRLGNMAYVVWVNAFNCVQILLFCAVESLLFGDLYIARTKAVEKQRIARATSKVMHAFNRNGLAVFLVANLLTGAIGLSVRTIDMDDLSAMAILITYLGILAGFALTLDHFNISIKL